MPATIGRTTKRVHGLDVARALAMVGMVIAHYVEQDSGTGIGATVRAFVDGRAMPLFMVLGGVGISFLVRRSTDPDRDLLIRAGILFPMGLILQELTDGIAIILQYYALFFVIAIGLRRLPTRMLLGLGLVLMAAGAYSKQVWAPQVDSYAGWQGIGTLFESGTWWSLVVSGYYPFLPAGAFLTIGMWIGRRDLRLPRVALSLASVGLVLALVGSWGGAWIGDRVGASGAVIENGQAALADDLVQRFAAEEGLTLDEAEARLATEIPTTASVEAVERVAQRIERSTAGFRWQRLFDASGHSQMPAWVIGAAGMALFVIGGSLLVASRLRLFALSVLGEMALTFYAYQAVLINWTPEKSSTTLAEEYLVAAALTLLFVVAGLGWKLVVGRGPLEQLLRTGAAPRVVTD
jgi:peptidoglycan/LPS O-acetylase OafA/YrhL